jgi:hypothetical protein
MVSVNLKFGGVVAIARRYDALSTQSSFACALPSLPVLDVIASVVLVHVGSLVFLVPVAKLVISDCCSCACRQPCVSCAYSQACDFTR